MTETMGEGGKSINVARHPNEPVSTSNNVSTLHLK